MKNNPQKNKPVPVTERKESNSHVVTIFLAVTILIFCFSLFKNISYPLVWNDESEGVMAGQRILEYGYPKVHDGKNTVISSLAPNIKVGYKEEYDANIIITWGNYYWAAIGVALGEFADDNYTKTALLRLPFTLMGLLGLVLFALSVRHFFANPIHYRIFLFLFVFVELFSISLVLHMREARYFSLVIFVSSCLFYLYTYFFLLKKMSLIKYCVLVTVLLFFTYHVNFIAFAILCAVLAFNIAFSFLLKVYNNLHLFKAEFMNAIKASIPIMIAVVLVYPFTVFFEMAKTSAALSEHVKFNFDSYKTNILMIYKYFTELEMVYTFLIIKIIWLVCRWYYNDRRTVKNNKSSPVSLMEQFSFFATSFLIIYALVISRTPWLFVRHYIVMQPVMVLVMLLDFFIILTYINSFQKKSAFMIKFVCISFLLVTFSLNAKNKIPYMKEHVYEITHQYKGVLDYIIPYIQENYKQTDTLIIATNYEEFSYMYYLKSKVTIGYVYNNLEDDLKHIPDIILFRKSWGTDPKYFNEFMQKAKYQKMTFPVADYPVNNIPELDFVIRHLFKTKLAANEQECAEMFVRVQ